MSLQPEVLTMFGLSEAIVRNQLILLEKYQKIHNWTAEDKAKKDSELWTNWLRKYLNRVHDDIKIVNDSDISNKRIQVMNSNNPR